jgi:hypothetical protein
MYKRSKEASSAVVEVVVEAVVVELGIKVRVKDRKRRELGDKVGGKRWALMGRRAGGQARV